jgi:hypothetical protein
MDEFAQSESSGYSTDNLQTPVSGFKVDTSPYNSGSLPQSFMPLEFDFSGKNGEPVVFDNTEDRSISSQNVPGHHMPKKTPLSSPAEINNQSYADSGIQPSVINEEARAEVEEDLESFRLRLEAALGAAQFEKDIQVIVQLSSQEVDDLTNDEPTIDPAGSFWNDSDGESHPAMDVDHSLPGPHQGEDVSGRFGSYVTGGQVDSEQGGGGRDQWEVGQGMTLNVSQRFLILFLQTLTSTGCRRLRWPGLHSKPHSFRYYHPRRICPSTRHFAKG